MDFIEILIKLIIKLNRNISRKKERPAAKEITTSTVSVSEKKTAKKDDVPSKVQLKSQPVGKTFSGNKNPEKNTKKQHLERRIKRARITIEASPGEMPAGDFGVSNSIIGDEDESAEMEISGLIKEIKEVIKQESKNQKKHSKQKESLEKIIRKAEQQPPEPFDERAEEIKELFEKLKQKPKSEMIYFVMYDIENNRVRTKIAKYLEEKGLRRVQKSIFLGQTKRSEYHVIRTALTAIQESYENRDSIFMVPMPEDYLKSMYMIGEQVDFALTLHRSNTVFI